MGCGASKKREKNDTFTKISEPCEAKPEKDPLTTSSENPVIVTSEQSETRPDQSEAKDRTKKITESVVKLPEGHPSIGSVVELSPFDENVSGRAIPAAWFYPEVLDQEKLLDALNKILHHYPCLCGRYEKPASEGGPLLRMNLNNHGIGLWIDDGEAIGETMIVDFERPLNDRVGPDTGYRSQGFGMFDHAVFLPPNDGMNPDTGNPEMQVCRIKLSKIKYKDNSVGTAIGCLIQHGVVDMDTICIFMRNWAGFYSQIVDGKSAEEMSLLIPVKPERWGEGWDPKSVEKPEQDKPENHDFAFDTPDSEENKAAMASMGAVMGRLWGANCCVVEITPRRMEGWKSSALKAIDGPMDQLIFSTDDILTARTWRALARTRWEQLPGMFQENEITTLIRAMNVRKRTSPPLTDGYCGNGVVPIKTKLTLKEVMNADSATSTPENDAFLAKLLREGVNYYTGENIAKLARFMKDGHLKGLKAKKTGFNELCVIVSSWIFDWESTNFGPHKPVALEHGAFLPFVIVFTPRRGGVKNGGVNIFTSGTDAATRKFVEELMRD